MTEKPFKTSEDHLQYVLKRTYRFACGDMEIGSQEMIDDISDALCNLIGDDEFVKFVESLPDFRYIEY